MTAEDKLKTWDVPNQQNIPLTLRKDSRFTRKWFKRRNQCTFSTFLAPKFDGSKPINILQIGVFEGMDLLWQMQVTASHHKSFAIGIDPWEATRKLSTEKMEQVRENAEHNLAHLGQKVILIRGYSQEVMAQLAAEPATDAKSRRARMRKGLHASLLNADWRNRFDLIIIDGDHRAAGCYADAVNSLPLARPGAWLVFDDVENRIEKKDHVKDALRRFLDNYGDRVKFVWKHRHCECYEVLDVPSD